MATKLGSVVGFRNGIYNGYKVIGTQTLGLRGLVLWLKFNEGSGNIAYDSSFYNNHGTIYGATWTDGKFGKALSFDGVDDWVEVSSSDTLTIPDRTELTVTAWVKRKEMSKFHTIVSLGGWNREGWTFRIESNNKIMFIARFTDGTITGEIEGGYIDTNWHFVAVVYDGRVHLYVDGEEVASSDYFGKVISGRDFQLKIGVLDTGNCFFNGIIDEVRIYNRALSENEIKMLYYNRIGAVPSKII